MDTYCRRSCQTSFCQWIGFHAGVTGLSRFGIVLALSLAVSAPIQASTTPGQLSSPTEAVPLAVQSPIHVLVVGSEQDYPPFATGMTDGAAGGFTVDLWKEVAAKAHLNYVIRVRPFREILQEFKDGKIDVLINLAQSKERRKFADFSVPHVVVHGAIFVRTGQSGIQSEADLAGKSIIVLNADLAHDYAVSKGLQKNLVLVDTSADGMRLLASGKHDAMLLSRLVGLQTLNALDLKNVEPLPMAAGFSQKFAFATHHGQTELLADLNEGLAIAKANGVYETLYEKSFGIYEPKQVSWRDILAYVLPVAAIGLAWIGYLFYRRQKEREQARLALAQSRDILLAIIDNAPIRVFWKDRQLRYLGCNTAFAKDAGMQHPSEMIGKDDYQMGWASQAELYRSGDLAVMTSEQAKIGFEEQQTTPDGKVIWLRTSKVPLHSGNGNVSGVLGIYDDITDAKLAELALSASEEKFRKTFYLTPDAMNINRLDDGMCLSINDGFTKLMGYSEDEIIGHSSLEFNIWEHPSARMRLVAALKRDGSVSSFEATFRDKKGGIHFGSMSAAIIEINGQPHIISVTRDITERKKIEEKLRQLSTAVEQSSATVVITDIDATIEYVNPRFTEVTGYSAADVIGKNSRILQSKLTPPETYRELWESLAKGVAWHGEFTNRRKNGEFYWEDSHIAPVQDSDGKVTHYVAVKTDISQRKKMEVALIDSQAHLNVALTQYRELLDRIPVGIYKLRMRKDGKICFDFVSPRFCKQVGLTFDQLVNDADATFRWVHEGDLGELIKLNEVAKERLEPFVWEGRMNVSGHVRWMHVESSPTVQTNGDILWNGMQFDITERKQMEDAVRQFAFHDALTKLPNRRLLLDRLSQAISVSRRSTRYCAVIFMDLDNFKPLNDTHGHEVGDLLLIEAANRLICCVREVDTVARFGGDEFVVLLTELGIDKTESNELAMSVAEKIRAKISEQYDLVIKHSGHLDIAVTHQCTASIGIALFLGNDDSPDDVLNWADAAMYQAKDNGRNMICVHEARNAI